MKNTVRVKPAILIVLFFAILSSSIFFISKAFAAGATPILGSATVSNTSNLVFFTSEIYGANVVISDPDPDNANIRTVSGYSWSEDLGWIRFTQGVENGGVFMDYNTGALTGSAYVMNTGALLDFTNYGSNTVIDTTTGVFSGYVWSEDLGWVEFDNTSVQDENPPVGSISINSGDSYTNSTLTSLSVQAEEVFPDSGVTEMIICNVADFTGCTWEGYIQTKEWTLLSGDGTKSVYIKFKDAQNNESIAYSDTISLDTTSPTVSVSGVPLDWQSSNATVSLDCDDSSQSGCDSSTYEYRIENSTFDCDSTGDWLSYIEPVEITSHQYVCMRADDNLSNGYGYSSTHQIKVDKTDPACGTWDPDNPTWTNSNQTFTLSGSTDSGGSTISISGGTCEVSVNGNTCNVDIEDNAGNLVTCTSAQAKIDTTAPTGSIVINSGASNTESRDVTLKFSATDIESGVSQMNICNNMSFVECSWETYKTSKNWQLTQGDGTKTVYVKFRDNLSLVSNILSDTIQLNTPELVVEEPSEQEEASISVPAYTPSDEEEQIEEVEEKIVVDSPRVQKYILTLVDKRGKPLKGAEVTLEDGTKGYTDDSGVVEFKDVPEGRQKVSILYNGYKMDKEINVLGESDKDISSAQIDIDIESEGGIDVIRIAIYVTLSVLVFSVIIYLMKRRKNKSQ